MEGKIKILSIILMAAMIQIPHGVVWAAEGHEHHEEQNMDKQMDHREIDSEKNDRGDVDLQKEFPNFNIVVTAEDHFELASIYRQRAAYYRKEAENHRAMKEVYRKSAEGSAGSVRESWDLMDQHCDAIINQLEGVAVMMDEQAEWHEKWGSWVTKP